MESEPQPFELDEITPGDLVRVLGVGDDDAEEHWDAVVTGTLHAAGGKPDTVEVCFLEPRLPGIASFRVCADEVDLATVEMHVRVDAESLRSVAEGWKQLGYVPLDEDDFWIHGEDIAPHYGIPYLSEDYGAMIRDIYGDDSCDHLVGAASEDSEWDPDCDFIVPDDLADEFTEAAESSEFVRETHAAVRAMSERYVISDNTRQRDIRNFLNALHYKYST